MTAHGTTAAYWRGCHCLRCRQARAVYQQALRAALARGKLPPRRLVSSAQTRKRIRQLLVEGFTRRQIALRVGLRCGVLRLHNHVTVQTAERVEALWRALSE